MYQNETSFLKEAILILNEFFMKFFQSPLECRFTQMSSKKREKP